MRIRFIAVASGARLSAVLVIAAAFAGCGQLPLSNDEAAQQLAARIDAANPEKQQQRFGVLASLVGKSFERPNHFTDTGESLIYRFSWRVPGVSVESEALWRGRVRYRGHYQFNPATNLLDVFENAQHHGSAYVLSDGTVFKPVTNRLMNTIPSHKIAYGDDGSLIIEADKERLMFAPIRKDDVAARLAEQQSIGGDYERQAQRQKSAERSEFWANVATGIQVVAQASNEAMAEHASLQAAAQARQSSLAAANAARAADAAARSRAEQERASREAGQLAALNRTIAANQRAAAQMPSQKRAAHASALASSQAATGQLAAAQQAAQARSRAAEMEAQRHERIAQQSQERAQAYARVQAQSLAHAARSSAPIRKASLRAGELMQPTAAGGAMPSAGEYQMEGGTYAIVLEVSGNDLVVVEPNKRSVYTRQGDGSFHFRNPVNGVLYGIRSAGDGAVEAFKPGSEAAPTRLVLVSSDAGALPEVDDRYIQLAEQYRARAQSDPGNAQSWTACAAVAMKRAVSSKRDADRYAGEMAGMLKQMDSRATPCADVIPAAMF